MNSKVAQLCFTYDQAREASRDPGRRDRQDRYLEILSDKRKAIEDRVKYLIEEFPDPLAVAETTYFNAWLALRGGWSE